MDPVDLRRVPDLDSLLLLLRVGETGSLGRAAEAHALQQPAVSARIRSMEGLVGFTLVTRTSRGSHLTPAGELVAGWARQVLAAAGALSTGIDALRDDRRHRLRVVASMTVAEHLMPGWLTRLAAEHADLAVSLQARNSTDVARLVLAGEADIGFVEGPRIPEGLQRQVVARDRLVVVVAPGHPWARRRGGIDAAELAGTRLVHREASSGTRAALEDALVAALQSGRDGVPQGGPAPIPVLAAPVLEASTTSAVCSAAAAGAGPAVVSVLAVAQDVAAGRLVTVTVRGVDLGRELRAVWPAGARPSGAAGDLLVIAVRGRGGTGASGLGRANGPRRR